MTILTMVYMVVTLALSSPAMAQTSTSAAPLVWDVNALVQWLFSLTAAIISGAIPILVVSLLRKWHLDNNQTVVDALTSAASRAAGIGYNWMLTQASSHIEPVEIKNQAVMQGVRYIQERYPQYTKIKNLNANADAIAKMVDGELGKLLAVDPNVQVGNKINTREVPKT